jgi:crotonobetainyl-CoA:carnitine CoA-transferase CaiB-like acyl-CoA transferase
MVSMISRPTSLLEGLRVLELDEGLAQFAGKWIADMGAQVIKVEPASGSPARHIGPFVDDQPDPDRSLFFWATNTSKRSAVIDLDGLDGKRLFERLLTSADVFVYGGSPARLAELDISPTRLVEKYPSLVACLVTPFGLDGPWRDYASSDAVQLGLGGPMGVSGYDPPTAGPAGSTSPIAPTGGHAAALASMAATIGLLAAVIHRNETGRGQVLDVAAHDVISVSSEMSNIYWEYGHGNVVRQSGRHARPMQTPVWNHLCADGKYFSALPLYLDDARFAVLAEWLAEDNGQTELLADDLKTEAGRAGNMARIVSEIATFCASRTTHQLFDGAKRRRLPWAPVNAPEELLDEEHLRVDRRAFLDLDHSESDHPIRYPAPFFQSNDTEWTVAPAPRLGQDTAAVERNGFDN